MSRSKRSQSKSEVEIPDLRDSARGQKQQALSEQKKKYDFQDNSYRLKDKPSEHNSFNCSDSR